MHKSLNSFEKVQIFEMIDYRHITDKDRKQLSVEVNELYEKFNPNAKTQKAVMLGTMGVLIAGLTGALIWKSK